MAVNTLLFRSSVNVTLRSTWPLSPLLERKMTLTIDLKYKVLTNIIKIEGCSVKYQLKHKGVMCNLPLLISVADCPVFVEYTGTCLVTQKTYLR